MQILLKFYAYTPRHTSIKFKRAHHFPGLLKILKKSTLGNNKLPHKKYYEVIECAKSHKKKRPKVCEASHLSSSWVGLGYVHLQSQQRNLIKGNICRFFHFSFLFLFHGCIEIHTCSRYLSNIFMDNLPFSFKFFEDALSRLYVYSTHSLSHITASNRVIFYLFI